MRQSLFNILFWIVSISIFYNLYARNYEIGFLDVAYTFLLHLSLAYAFYSGSILANRYLIFSKYNRFMVASLLNLAVSVAIHYFAYDLLADILFPNHFLVTFFTFFEIVAFNCLYFFFGTLITMTFNWFALKDRQIKIEREKNEIQMQTLKSQINPHFLFNSLNNIYSSLSKTESGPRDYIMKLADSLRYMIYETDDDRVPLSNELDYIENYIQLEKLRLENPKIDLNIKGDIEGLLIAPLILIPIIENCFKHINKDEPISQINIVIEGENLQLDTKNSFDPSIERGGMGLRNLDSRLSLLYPNQHHRSFEREGNYFHSSLSMNLQL